MTSSLVGSEMCIRDRTGSLMLWNGLGCHGPALAHVGVDGVVSRAALHRCLLYTSDAADDM
eukprot:12420665-Prorocentrum_lima.AAC.1